MKDIITALDMETEVSKSLYRYIFNRVVSRPRAELRHNVHLDPISGSSQINSFSFDGSSYQLPYSGSWFVFLVDNRHIHHIRLPQDKTTATCLADRKVLGKPIMGYCTRHHVDVRVICSSTGRSIPRKQIYVIPISEQKFLFVIPKDSIARYANSAETSPTDLWINFYYHHTSSFSVTDYTYDEASDFLMKASDSLVHAYRNGYLLMDPNKISSSEISNTDHLELVKDPDIVGYFDVVVKEDYNSNGYHTLFHIPKKLNPDNEIIGHGVCDIVLYKEGYKNEGLVLSRAQTTKFVQTLTHNDFGISTSFLRQYGANINHSATLMARVYVRNHHRKDLVLSREANYTDCLYRLSDDLIIQHLKGKLNVPCWTAASLSKSAYAKILDADYPEIIPENLRDTISALGYATAADTICKRVFHIPIVPGVHPCFNLALPLCYVGCDNIKAHVYIDGFMVDNGYVRYKKNKQYLTVELLNTTKLGPYGDNLKSYIDYINDLEQKKEPAYFTVEIFEGNPYRAKYVNVPAHGSANVIVDQDYRIYEAFVVDRVNYIPNKTIYQRFNPSYTYGELTRSEYQSIADEVIEGSYRKLTIKNMGTRNKTYLITSKHAYAKICGVEHQLKEMNYDIFCTHLLTVDALEFPDLVDGEIEETTNHIKIPYLNKDQSILAYLNHRELTEGLDYRMYPIRSSIASQYAGQFIVFQNVDYLTVANNVFEAFSVAESKIVSTAGFLTDGNPTLEGYLASYSNTGILFTDGKAYSCPPSNVIGMYNTNLHKSMRKGTEAKLRAFIPYCLKSIFDKYAKQDTTTLKIVLDYMSSLSIDVEAPAIIERSHHIYSVFLQYITEQVLRGKLEYDESWSDEKIRQVLRKYEDLLKYDIGLDQNNIEVTDPTKFIEPPKSGLDYRFVDVLPTYRVELPDPDLTVNDTYPTIHITGSISDTINGTYICMNPDLSFVRPGERYCDHTDGIKSTLVTDRSRFNDLTRQVWENGKGGKIYHGQPDQWYIVQTAATPSEEQIHYTAFDNYGTDKIWELDWVPVNDAEIEISTTDIEIHTAGEFLARRIAYTTNISDRNFLTKVARIYLNRDLVQDGVNP